MVRDELVSPEVLLHGARRQMILNRGVDAGQSAAQPLRERLPQRVHSPSHLRAHNQDRPFQAVEDAAETRGGVTHFPLVAGGNHKTPLLAS